MKRLVFLPSATYPGFDQKAELLLLPEFRQALGDYLPSFRTYSGEERNFDLNVVEMFQFRNPKQGVVKFWDKTRAGGFGIIERMEANGSITSFSFNYRSFKEEGCDFTNYGDPIVVRGDLVTWEAEMPVPNKPGTNQLMPNLVQGLEVVHQTQL
jgi:hypothetical protein